MLLEFMVDVLFEPLLELLAHRAKGPLRRGAASLRGRAAARRRRR